MSSVPMLPEMSTANMRSLPEAGSDTGSPISCGLAAAVTRNVQARQRRIIFHRRRPGSPEWAVVTLEKSPKLGTVSAASARSLCGNRNLTSRGRGSAQNTHGHNHSIIGGLYLVVCIKCRIVAVVQEKSFGFCRVHFA